MRSRSMRESVAVAAFLVLLVVLAGRTSRLGDAPLAVPSIQGCASVPEPCIARASADRVFYGQVLGTTACPTGGLGLDDHVHIVRFRVSRLFKGEVAPAADWSAAFRERAGAHRFSQGERVIVYTVRRGSAWETACTRTRAFTAGDTPRLNDEIARLERCGAGQ